MGQFWDVEDYFWPESPAFRRLAASKSNSGAGDGSGDSSCGSWRGTVRKVVAGALIAGGNGFAAAGAGSSGATGAASDVCTPRATFTAVAALAAQSWQKPSFLCQHFETQTRYWQAGQRLRGACGVHPHDSQTSLVFRLVNQYMSAPTSPAVSRQCPAQRPKMKKATAQNTQVADFQRNSWWRFTDSNRGPVDYDSIALTD
jgi:hypothetical protein